MRLREKILPASLLAVSAPIDRSFAGGVTQSTTVLRRGADPTLTSSLDVSAFGDDGLSAGEGRCAYDGTISFAHPMSLRPGDQYFTLGQLQLKAMEMMVEEINTGPRCGVAVGGKRYGISMSTYGDDSSKEKVRAIVEHGMIPAMAAAEANATFWLAPYSSGLTGQMSPFANDTNTVVVAGGSASTKVFEGYPTIFGTPPPTRKYLAQGIESLAAAGARTYASVWEDASFTRGVCAALPDLAARLGLAVQSQTEVAKDPQPADLDPVARNLSRADPDVVVTCVYDRGCAEWVAALRRSGWSPRAQVFTVCVGMDSFVDAAGRDDVRYMTGIATWDPHLAVRDAVVGWNASAFDGRFAALTGRRAAYQSASAAGAVGALVQAIERAGDFDAGRIASVLAGGEFDTVFGTLSFDGNGQSKAPGLHLQYNGDAAVEIVHPAGARTGALVYPMPGWAQRDCMFRSTCETGSVSTVVGTCRADGTCACDDGTALSGGVGPDASCLYVPAEDMHFVSPGLISLGVAMFCVQAALSVSCAAWAWRNRNNRVVKASQPLFLCLISFGAFVMSVGIVPMGIQDLEPSTDVDAACMGAPWLFSMGFSVVFSALFAKIWRIRLVWKAAAALRRGKVEAKDVAYIMVGVIALQAAVLLSWQLIDPMRWEREVLRTDANGYPLESYGACRSENGKRFLVPLVCIDGAMLLYSLYLCYVTRNVSSDFQEGQWITASVLSIVQILVLSIPILMIVGSNNDAFYFVRASIFFLMSSTVTMLIFFPKIYRAHFKAEEAPRATRFGSAISNGYHASRYQSGVSVMSGYEPNVAQMMSPTEGSHVDTSIEVEGGKGRKLSWLTTSTNGGGDENAERAEGHADEPELDRQVDDLEGTNSTAPSKYDDQDENAEHTEGQAFEPDAERHADEPDVEGTQSNASGIGGEGGVEDRAERRRSDPEVEGGNWTPAESGGDEPRLEKSRSSRSL